MGIESEVVSRRAQEAARKGRHQMPSTADEPVSTVERGAKHAPLACCHTSDSRWNTPTPVARPAYKVHGVDGGVAAHEESGIAEPP